MQDELPVVAVVAELPFLQTGFCSFAVFFSRRMTKPPTFTMLAGWSFCLPFTVVVVVIILLRMWTGLGCHHALWFGFFATTTYGPTVSSRITLIRKAVPGAFSFLGFDWVFFRDLDLTEIGAGLPADGLAVGFDALLLTQARERMGSLYRDQGLLLLQPLPGLFKFHFHVRTLSDYAIRTACAVQSLQSECEP